MSGSLPDDMREQVAKLAEAVKARSREMGREYMAGVAARVAQGVLQRDSAGEVLTLPPAGFVAAALAQLAARGVLSPSELSAELGQGNRKERRKAGRGAK